MGAARERRKVIRGPTLAGNLLIVPQLNQLTVQSIFLLYSKNIFTICCVYQNKLQE